MPIYTKKGDKGKTRLLSSRTRFGEASSVSKNSVQISAIGAIDELNSYLGVCGSYVKDPSVLGVIRTVQGDLLTMGSILAGSDLKFYISRTKRLEKEIDKLEKKLPKLTNFILPGGVYSSSHLHFARSLCRRAERKVVALGEETKVRPQILTYINRLSDLLFMLARNENNQMQVSDSVWNPKT